MARPPPPVPKPVPMNNLLTSNIKVVRAVYKYTAQHIDELSFDEGDTLYILDQVTDPSWWKAKCGDNVGLIPSNYVEENTEAIDYPLHEAAKRGNLSFLKDCLQNKVSANGLDKSGSTALHWAAHGGHIECVLRLLDVPNLQINVQNKLGDTPLHSAAWKGHAAVTKELLSKGAKTNLLNKDNKTPCDLARDPEVAAVLRQLAMTNTENDDYADTDESD